MNKKPNQSKVLWYTGLLTVLGILNAIFMTIDVTKLPPDVAKWLVPVIAAVAWVLRRFGSNIQ